MELNFEYKETVSAVAIERDGDSWIVTLPDGSRQRIVAERGNDNDIVVTTVDDSGGAARFARSQFLQTSDSIDIFHRGRVYSLSNPTLPTSMNGRARKSAARTNSGLLTAPMVGTISELFVAAGDTVAAGQTIASIGSMKVYVAVDAPFAGTVTAVYVTAGAMVSAGDSIAQITPVEAKEG